ncbi:Fur family transcriptional regulator [Paenibacillus urinalis]|uniref:Fur family transcriptional regulator n=1 Tax=Paenibacillus urinalis TaxID=521520 RepID=A0AAX3MUR6_9BACL|nr:MULTISPECIES: Fur family transcriptional regulator [Paenibacillus]WDH81351.1 Fur family transcriptional regulator [Paenibacillus urinalis]WDH97400.1 Fur family transcriptional regulator [Paenibacillus urinalis]WDI01066.1 Fur family transcriptional regulator [Paenibacillus urinalis]GAK39883.1 ferric-uptake regulator [Paenibacillus sp. TCA20]
MLSTDQIIEAMSGQGLRITDQRKTLARLFAESEGYLSPKDVYEYMGKSYSGLSFDTVYRNLRVMQELGVLEQVIFEDGVKFKASCSSGHHHHHLICLNCQKTLPIEFCPMNLTDTPDQFQVVEHKFEIFGYCRECQTEGKGYKSTKKPASKGH